jgi:hypothetical protein
MSLRSLFLGKPPPERKDTGAPESDYSLTRTSDSPRTLLPPGMAPLATGLLLLAIYFVIAAQDKFFLPSDFDFPQHAQAIVHGFIPEIHLYSILWKLVLLLPSSILMAVGLARTGLAIVIPTAGRERIILGMMVVLVLGILVVSTRFLFRETEVTDDENAYDYQAKTLLMGRLSNPGVPAVRCFDNHHIINNATLREGKYTPGHPAVIALGMALGDRYTVTIGLSALTILLIYGIGFELYGDRRLALLAAVLTALSPFFYLVSSSLLSHTTETFFLALFIYLFLRARSAPQMRIRLPCAFGAGLALGYAFNVRQLTAIAFAIPIAGMIAADFRTPGRGKFRTLGLMTAGFGIMFLLTLGMNYLMTGNGLLFPFTYYRPDERMGFGVFGHTFPAGIWNTAFNFLKLNAVLFGFPASLMFLIPVLVVPKAPGDRLLIGIIASHAVAYLFYYSAGVSDLGPVYYYEMIIPAVLLSARGIMILHRFASARVAYGRNLIPLFLTVSCAFALVTSFPERAAYAARLTERVRGPYELVASVRIHHAVVMIDSWPSRQFVFGYRNPSPDFKDDIIYCRVADPASNAALAGMFPDRRFYVMSYSPEEERTNIREIDARGTLPAVKP